MPIGIRLGCTRSMLLYCIVTFDCFLPVLSPPRATNLHVAESRRCFYFLQNGNLLRAEVATNNRSSQCNIVAQEIARKFCPYHLAFRVVFLRILSCKFSVNRVTVLGVFLGRLNVLVFRRVFRNLLRTLTIIISLGAPKGSLRLTI